VCDFFYVQCKINLSLNATLHRILVRALQNFITVIAIVLLNIYSYSASVGKLVRIAVERTAQNHD